MQHNAVTFSTYTWQTMEYKISLTRNMNRSYICVDSKTEKIVNIPVQ